MAQRRCYGCMKPRSQSSVCEHCGFTDKPNEVHQLPMGIILKERYLIGRVLGQGGFGITYIGWDAQSAIPVAIKEFFPSAIVHRQTRSGLEVTCYNGESDQSFVKNKARFSKEANSLLQMKGLPEIVQVMDFFEENNTAYIVMEYVEGITLKNYIKQLGHRINPEVLVDLLRPLLDALRKVHALHLIHRDISPDNIMLPRAGGVKLIDFGTVRYMDDSDVSKSTEAILKPGFAPMEQYQNRGNLGPWTDVYALCATMYYCMTGKVPQDAPSRMVEEAGIHLERLIPDVPPRIAKALEAGMAIRISNRLQSVDELYRLLYEPASAKQQTKTTTKVPPVNTQRAQPQQTTSGAGVMGADVDKHTHKQPTYPKSSMPNSQPQNTANRSAKPVNRPVQSSVPPAAKPKKRKKNGPVKFLCFSMVAAVVVLMLTYMGNRNEPAGNKNWATTFFTSQAAALEDGWYSDGEYRYYYQNNEPVYGWQSIDGISYYFDEYGRLVENRSVMIGDDIYTFNAYARVAKITYARKIASASDKPFYFESSHGDIREVRFMTLDPSVRSCTSLQFDLEVGDVEYGNPEGTWVVCLRIDGQWVRMQEFDVQGSSGSVVLNFGEPVTFDAFTAYLKTGGSFRADCYYQITQVTELRY